MLFRSLVLIFDRAIDKTAKKVPHIKMAKIGAASFRLRYAVPVVFIALFATSFLLRGNVGIAYTTADYYKANQVFTIDNPLVVLYENKDEGKLAPLVQGWADAEGVLSVNAYATTVGIPLSVQEIAYTAQIDEDMVAQLFQFYAISTGQAPQEKIPLYDMMQFIIHNAENPAFAAVMTEEMAAQLSAAIAEMEDGRRFFVGESFSRVIINTSLPEESEETFAFIQRLEQDLSGAKGEVYILGNSATAYDMSLSFPGEMDWITILTVIVIFLVVAIAFRSLSVPLILLCIIQCAVFFTMGVAYLQGNAIFYLPMLVVQCILLGATVDYGIFLSSYYREARKTMEKKEAIIAALNNSIHTILTSGLILVLVSSILGVVFRGSDPAVSEILVTLATGGICAMLLVIFILPGLLVAFDKFVIRRKVEKDFSV